MFFQLGLVWKLCLLAAWSVHVLASPVKSQVSIGQCRKTKVVVLGAGLAGIMAAQSLANARIQDFIVVEYNDYIGGRVTNTPFGKKADGTPYNVELGANWVHGLHNRKEENPIWTLAKQHKLAYSLSDYDAITTYTHKGPEDFRSLFASFDHAYSIYEADAGEMLKWNRQDRTVRSGLALAGWNPSDDFKAQATEWWRFDFTSAERPDDSSQVFSVVGNNATFYHYNDDNNMILDQRGFKAFIEGEAKSFLGRRDKRLLLNTVVTHITYGRDGVRIDTRHGDCIQADYAICTFSLGVLQNDAVTFAPPLPTWKREGIATFSMATYTKIFLQFPSHQVFWPRDRQFLLYADPTVRGHYPSFQNLDHAHFFPGSGILVATVVAEQSHKIEHQDDATTQREIMVVLRRMFGAHIPEPTHFMYPRWGREPWAHGSYSNWPPGTSLEMHQNLRANVGRLWFAGEATHPQYFGFLQGAYHEGRRVGQEVAQCVQGHCRDDTHYGELTGTTPWTQYNVRHGWVS